MDNMDKSCKTSKSNGKQSDKTSKSNYAEFATEYGMDSSKSCKTDKSCKTHKTK